MSKRIFKLLVLTLITVVASFAQLPVTNIEDWRVVEPSLDEFTIMSPGEMKVTDSGEEFARKYGILASGTYLFVISNPRDSSFWLRDLEKFLKDSNQLWPELAKLDKPARISFKDQFGFYNDLLFTKTENRLYVVHVVSESDDDAIAKRFLNSFRIVAKSIATQESEPEPTSSYPRKSSPTTPSVAIGDGKEGGNGLGVGTGQSSDSTGAVKTNPTLRLLSVPRPAYTNAARFYDVSGSVDLRITFLSSGQIGSISRMKKLPFGLTEQAIEAAKRIQFEPAHSNGNPITVTKILQYTFTIY